MAWTYSGDPSASNRDRVRFEITDTDSAAPLLTDGEIDYLLTAESTVPRAIVAAAERVLAILSRQVDKSVGDLRISASQRHAQYQRTLLDLRRRYVGRGGPWAGGISQGDKETREDDDDRVEPAFARDQMVVHADWIYSTDRAGEDEET